SPRSSEHRSGVGWTVRFRGEGPGEGICRREDRMLRALREMTVRVLIGSVSWLCCAVPAVLAQTAPPNPIRIFKAGAEYAEDAPPGTSHRFTTIRGAERGNEAALQSEEEAPLPPG